MLYEYVFLYIAIGLYRELVDYLTMDESHKNYIEALLLNTKLGPMGRDVTYFVSMIVSVLFWFIADVANCVHAYRKRRGLDV